MAGRKPLDREALSVKALDVAEAMIAEHGLGALNARRLATGTGCSVGTLYNMFGSLDHLVRILNTRTLDQLHEALKAASTNGATPEDRMVAMSAAYIGFAGSRPLVWQAVFEHRLPEGAPKADWYIASIERMARLGVTVLSPVFKSGDVRRARRLAILIWSGVHGICSLALSGSLNFLTEEDPRHLAEDLIRGYFAGLAEDERAALAHRNS